MAQALAKSITTPSPEEETAAPAAAEGAVSAGTPTLVRDDDGRARRAPERRNWVVQYIFADDAGKAKLSIITVTAPSYEAAKAYAVRHAPGKEFILSLHPESGEQYLGQVRHKARALSGK